MIRVLAAVALAAAFGLAAPSIATAQPAPDGGGAAVPNGGAAAVPVIPDEGDASTIAVPPAPAIIAAPPTIQPIPGPAMTPPPGLAPPASPPDTDSGDSPPAGAPAGSASQTPPPAMPDAQLQDIAPVPPNDWVPGATATLGVLNKIDGSVSQLSIPVGGQSVVGDLQVSVQACMIRPPSQVPDAAVFIALQSTQNASQPPDYRGWLVRSAPGSAVAGDASETFRIISCS